MNKNSSQYCSYIERSRDANSPRLHLNIKHKQNPIFKACKSIFIILFLGFFLESNAQEIDLKTIMQDPSWMGVSPSLIGWDEQGKHLYFSDRNEVYYSDSLFKINASTKFVQKIHRSEASVASGNPLLYNSKRTKRVTSEGGKLQLIDVKSSSKESIAEFSEVVRNPQFFNANDISFQLGNDLFVWDAKAKTSKRLTNIKKGNPPSPEKSPSAKDEFLQHENLFLLEEVRKQKERYDQLSEARKSQQKGAFQLYLKDWSLRSMRLSPNQEFAYVVLTKSSSSTYTKVPNYIDESGYTEDLNARPKVGDASTEYQMLRYDFKKDTAIELHFELPEMDTLPQFTQDYPDKDWSSWKRNLQFSAPKFDPKGKQAVVEVRSSDNKHRWICLLKNEAVELIDHQHDEAWIGGPGINSYGANGVLDWLPDGSGVYFQSEESGYSHLYVYEVRSGKTKALTQGNFEVFDPQISKDGKHWYFTSSEIHPGERHLYKMPMNGGEAVQLTSLSGSNLSYLSPDEKQVAINYSKATLPWEIYLQKNTAKAKPVQLTDGVSVEFKAKKFEAPEFVTFQNRDEETVHARLYLPKEETKNGAAVVFVHGAGYLQNAHKWWSSYFREFMFHQKLMREGFTVIDVDYNASAGYGRDWRTSIYRHMGGKDLSDQVDAVQYLVENHGINASKVGIYGGSYGGFITLMAMFNEPETFAAGAALRSVTDWAHYNHGYTSNILNEPTEDPEAYRKSSPIYFAEGLQGDLLIAHGVLDVNVHFQDVVRLTQRLIELEKEHWEMAIYPIEDHGFRTASSWLDEYKRIYKLFKESLLE